MPVYCFLPEGGHKRGCGKRGHRERKIAAGAATMLPVRVSIKQRYTSRGVRLVLGGKIEVTITGEGQNKIPDDPKGDPFLPDRAGNPGKNGDNVGNGEKKR